MLRVSDIKIHISNAENTCEERKAIKAAVLSRLRLREQELLEFKIYKKSVDARKKGEIFFVYTVDIVVENEHRLLKKYSEKYSIKAVPPAEADEADIRPLSGGSRQLARPPVIIGMGPAGLFAGLVLSRYGFSPIILERGEDVDARTAKTGRFWKYGELDEDSNVQFGEGGAGTFSDGKLTTLINDKRCRYILKEFVKAGAPEEILYWSKPHVGTDLLKSVVKNIRNEIIANGGQVRFKSKVTDFKIVNGSIDAVIINGSEELKCDAVLLAIGHSARDTFEVLHRRGVSINQKPFSIGVRIEHPQKLINLSQYGEFADHPALGAADYKLSYHSSNGRSAYTFCMCPGGYVVAAASEEGHVVTNGMSEYKRDGMNANSAILVGVSPADFRSNHPLAGVSFQRNWERLAFLAGGGGYKAPVQLTGDFLEDRMSQRFYSVEPTYKPGTTFAELKNCLPPYVIDTLKEAILYFDKRIKGFAMPESILTGVETRSSSPVRINRNENFMSNIQGLYPIGEGAGYAGGIMSSAVDGIKAAEKIIENF